MKASVASPDTNDTWRNPWFWMLVAPPGITVVACLITIYISVATYDGLVTDDYYKQGLAINMQLARDKVATTQNLQAKLIPVTRDRIRLTLQAGATEFKKPETLQLDFLHPTRTGEDQQITLTRNAVGEYEAELPKLAASVWRLQLVGDDWRLLKQVRLPLAYEAEFKPFAP